jgi:hypothetical protein
MNDIILSFAGSDLERRKAIFAGRYLVSAASPATLALVEHARSMIRQTFQNLDPEQAQSSMDVAQFISRVGPLKSRFTNDGRTKELVRGILEEYGADLRRTCFDVPRMRVVPHSGYLSAGVSYAYEAHRDTWYSSPHCQVNYWMPIFSVTPERAMSMFPEYWDRPVPNSSNEFDYAEWCRIGRQQAATQTKTDTRKHPLPLAPIDVRSDMRVCGMPGDMLMFSSAHLHSTAPNTSGSTRFSIDFRTLHLDDIEAGREAPNVDCRAKGSTLGDFVRADDFSKIPADQINERLSAHAA